MNDDRFRGDVLRERRMAFELSVDDVYRKLRIPSACVEAFESGNVRAFPAETYAMGFLRTYCEFLQLDSEPWLAAYRNNRLAFLEAEATRPKPLSERPKWMREALTWATVSAMLALGWFAYTVVFQPSEATAENKVQAETLDSGRAELPSLHQ